MVPFEEYGMQYLENLKESLQKVDIRELQPIANVLVAAREEGRQIFVIGNGGSALTASHLAVDLGKGASWARSTGFRITALTESLGVITAMGNDVDYAEIFTAQLCHAARREDVLFAISGSGNSKNIIRAVEFGRSVGMTTVALTGASGGHVAPLAEHVWRAPSDHMGRIEDLHMIAVHILAYAFMEGEM